VPPSVGGKLPGHPSNPHARLRAEIRDPGSVHFTLTGAEAPGDASDYRLTDGRGRELPVAAVVAANPPESVLTPASPLDPLRVHYLEIPGLGLRTLVRRDPVFRRFRSSKRLGAFVRPDRSSTLFRIFAPRANAVRLYLYLEAEAVPSDALDTLEMSRDTNGVWEATAMGDLHGVWYDFTVHGPDDPGNWFYEARPVHVSDPYALVYDERAAKARVWRDGPPPPPVVGGRPAMEDMVAYEVHVQDFTDLLPVADVEAGTLRAMSRPHLVNRHGEAVGFDYLVGLGVNVVHLMPVQEYLHHPDAEWQAAFADDPFAQEMGIDRENYQWGYRTTHAFAVEGRYRARDAAPGAERDEFKELVAAFHARGISVVIDIVPNHTGENMDGRNLLLNFNVLDLPYYYRTNEDLRHIGPFGNEVKSEDRPMVQRWILDQMRHWVQELGVDGFRIDLAAQIDKQTLRRVRAELPADVIIYGEPWIPPSDPDVRANPEWAWSKGDAPITFFQDYARNAFQGSPFDVYDRGWAGGDGYARDAAMAALANHYHEEPRTTCGISYLDIHDNWALADRYALNDHNGLEGVDLGAVRIAAGLLLTSVGPVVIHGGTEMLRSKGLAPLEYVERRTKGGPIHIRGRHDTYNLRAPNRFVWDTLAPGSVHAAMRDYWRGLLALRMSEYGRVFRVVDVPDGHFHWITPHERRLLGYVVGGEVLVLANSGPQEGTFAFELPGPSWRQVGSRDRVDPVAGVGGKLARLSAGPQEIVVAGGSFLIWVREGD